MLLQNWTLWKLMYEGLKLILETQYNPVSRWGDDYTYNDKRRWTMKNELWRIYGRDDVML